MRPPVPPPSFFRAVPGFLIGGAVGVVLISVIRVLQGMMGAGDLLSFWFSGKVSHLLMGTWINDEAMIMFALLFGAFGFLWGAGAILNTPLDAQAESRALVVAEPKNKLRIPSDPDAIDMNAPARQLIGLVPVTVIIVGVIVITMIILVVLPLIGPDVTQVTDEKASVTEFSGDANFNFLGLVTFDVNQSYLIIGFTMIVILLVVGAPLGLALLFYLLNRQVAEAAAAPPEPDQGQQFFPIRLIGFFNQWVLDIVQMSGKIVRTR